MFRYLCKKGIKTDDFLQIAELMSENMLKMAILRGITEPMSAAIPRSALTRIGG
ncbi:hypothetical protein HNQ41_000716 [Texcoconibacillus texcoconensis]|uniref:Uncharacterized protein n=1 Tax=Texcoconibacillus texcoconensis TaxID=1095777 RepID=A0A840QMG6_9BACI|nr:hypothetical protein [Texcoconibacillus texcoconensis]